MELIAIVDENDNYLGEEEKGKCHDGDGILHRAFLTMAFTPKGELLLARRSHSKRLWPGYWDGTVASHVWKDESYEQASIRRMAQELGVACDQMEYLFKFHYKIAYKDVGTEHEICAVTRTENVEPLQLSPKRDEICEIRAVSMDTLIQEIAASGGGEYTPWLLIALEKMNEFRKGQ